MYKGAVFPPNEADRMETFNAIGMGGAPHDPMTARLCYVLSKLLQVKFGCMLSGGMVACRLCAHPISAAC